MHLSYSTYARNRAFSSAIKRIDPQIQPLLEAFEDVKLAHTNHQSVLVGITDDQSPQFFKEIESNAVIYQVLAGCSLRGGDEELLEDVFEILRNAIRLCPFATPYHEIFEALFKRMRPTIVSQ